MRYGDSKILLDYIFVKCSRFHHCVGVQLPAFDILFVLNIARRQKYCWIIYL